MITVLFLGAHVVRLAEPAVVAVRFCGELSRSEAREILHIAREHLSGRSGRVLLDLAQLHRVPDDGAQIVDALLAEAVTHAPARFVAIVRATAHQRSFLPLPDNDVVPVVLYRQTDQRPSLYLRYFGSPSEALVWLQLPADLLWASHEAIYLTHYF